MGCCSRGVYLLLYGWDLPGTEGRGKIQAPSTPLPGIYQPVKRNKIKHCQLTKIVIFGAGKIGRSFIGQLFSRAGYETVFVDTDEKVIHLLNRYHAYRVVIKGDKEVTILVKNVRGIHFSEKDRIIEEIRSTEIIAVSVGQQGLGAVIPLLAEGIAAKYRLSPGNPVDIIVAENIVNGDLFIRERLRQYLDQSFPVDSFVGLIETSIGKMVPIMTAEDLAGDPLQVFAEPYNTLILAKKSFRNPVPEVAGLDPRDNMKAWVDRKLFIHNLGHAAAAYFGYLKHPGRQLLYEVLADREVYDLAREAMNESVRILMKKYPEEFTHGHLQDHIADLLARFQNRALRDTVFRVGCDLKRKLGPEDRLVYPFREGHRLGLQPEKILYALVCGFYFRARDEHGRFHPNDAGIFSAYPRDIAGLLTEISGFDHQRDKDFITLASRFCEQINAKFDPEIKLK
jgi:mannitol-1-phosphate 5-dehydrogenase